MFAGCKSLEKIRIQNASIWDEVQSALAQSDLENYKDIKIVINGIHYDWWDNVVGCDKTVIDAIIQDKAWKIGFRAFDDCWRLTNITIPNSVKYIEGYAFNGCNSLTSVYCKATTPPRISPSHITGSIFGFSNFYGKIYVPRNSVKAYKTAEGWKEYANDIVGYDF